MNKIIIDSISNQKRMAVVEKDLLSEIVIDSGEEILAGSIYIGKIMRILPSKFAFINLGYDKNAFLYLNDKREKGLYKYNENKKKYELTIKQGQDIIVQVIREQVDEKGAAVTSQLSLSGKYAVLLCGDKSINISKKIDDECERKKLYNIAQNCLPKNCGIIMRTNSLEATEDEILKDIKQLYEKYKIIIKRGQFIKAPTQIYNVGSVIEKTISDLILKDKYEIIINNINEYEYFSQKFENVKLYNNKIPLFDYYSIEKQIEKALHERIWLKSGGFIIINQTEALNVIDVNTGKHIGKNHRETVIKTNEEAAREIVRQIRLRNLSGMIIIDFIDMKLEEDRIYIEEILSDLIKKDRISVTKVGMTELGLMQLTRKKINKPINKQLMCKCPCCNGQGYIYNEYYIADKIISQICSIFAQTIYNEITLSSNKRVINAFKGKNEQYKEIEKKYNAKIKFNIIITQRLDYYEIEKRRQDYAEK